MKKITLFIIISIFQLNSFAQNLKVKLHSIEGYGIYEGFAKKAISLLENVINSEKFKRKVLESNFSKTNGLTNQQLYEKIMMAHELDGIGGSDSVIDLRIRTIRVDGDEKNWKNNCQKSTIGIDGNGSGITAICPNKLQYWVSKNMLNELAGHFAHEYMHIIGFDHVNYIRGQNWREKTFVYQIGNIISELVKEQM